MNWIQNLFIVSGMMILTTINLGYAANKGLLKMRFVQIKAQDKYERTQIANMGISIEAIRSDSVWAFASQSQIQDLKKSGKKVLGNYDYKVARGGHDQGFDFPSEDAKFHNYDETYKSLRNLEQNNSDICKLVSIGKSVENRDLWALHINSTVNDLVSGTSQKPGAVYMGAHHAREHLSVEVPLMFAEYLMAHRKENAIGALIDSRDIWIIPMVNPDGAEFDLSEDDYQYWRKNRRNNGDGSFGVDLNRNYDFGWGTGGSSKDTSSETYMGPKAFSEPETQAVRDLVLSLKNTKVLLSFHTFSELILYPWGGRYEPIADQKDRKVFETMAQKMAEWNHYTPEKSSDLYIASGDTTDWAYAQGKIFAFTFELSPQDMWSSGGFYPGAGVIDKTFNDNLQPCLYLLEKAGDPYKVLVENDQLEFLNYYRF